MKNSMFRYADGIDKFLMLLGTLGSIGDGLQNPLMMYILSDVINSYGSSNGSLTNDDVDKVSMLIDHNLHVNFETRYKLYKALNLWLVLTLVVW